MKLSMQWKTSIILLALVLCVFINFIGIQMWINGSKYHGKVISLAGRQKMLTQKLTKEAMFIVNGFDVMEDIEKTKQLFEQSLDGLINGDNELGLPAVKNDEIKAQLQKVYDLWSNFKTDIDNVVSKEFVSLEKKELLYSSSLEILKEMDRGVEMMELDSSGITGKLRNTAVISLLFSLLVALSAFYYVKKNIIHELHETVGVANRLKDGDLTIMIDVKSKDETGELQNAMEGMIENLRMIVGEIIGVASMLASRSEEVSARATHLKSGIDKQSQQIEQSAATVTEISQTIMDVAKNANDASDTAKESVNIASEGKSVVEQTVNSMLDIAENVERSSQTIGSLGESSKQIGDIINVINEIAGQTNLLALNAAIEAARAGEQGRGFAVVADEVKKLAEKTAKATEEITEMIKKIQQETNVSVKSMEKSKAEAEGGVKLAEQARESLDKIVRASEQCLDMVRAIATASEEQSSAIDHVTSNMENVANVFGTSREGVSQINDATKSFALISSELMGLISWFKTDFNSVEWTSTETVSASESKKEHDPHST